MLYLVATPIGNLKDITLRAIETLQCVDIVACEDTRKTGFLLNHLGIKKKMVSFFEHNEEKSGEYLIGELKKGRDVALVSDAGTPVISDPGYTLVQKALIEEIEITSIPGPSAGISALILSGLETHSFVFRGFPPNKQGKRRNFLSADKGLPYTLIYYESKYRILKFLDDALEVLGDRDCSVSNDLTKMYEAVFRGKISVVRKEMEDKVVKGEYVVAIAGNRG